MTTYDVKVEGAIGDGINDDTQAIQTAIDRAVQSNGGTVFFPPGRYRITSTLHLNGLAFLEGSAWSTDNTDKGSFIYFDAGFSGNALEISGRNATVNQLGFTCEQPAPVQSWVPNDFSGGAAIKVKADDVSLTNILLFNVTRGIDASHKNGSIGRVTMNRIHGQPIKEGIKIDNALDVMKVNNVHFWPFGGDNEYIARYRMEHGSGLSSFRNDNPFYSDIFCLGYKVGMQFSSSQMPPDSTDDKIWGNTSKFKIVNADLDFCAYGILIDGVGTSGQVSNLSCQGFNRREVDEKRADDNHPQWDLPSYSGLEISADNVRLQGCNIHVFKYDSNGIRIGGNNTKATFENTWVKYWNLNTDELSFPAIEAATESSEVSLGLGRWFDKSPDSSAPDTGGIGTVNMTTKVTG
ncbi:MAG: hypothetical protein Roseis2KO_03540 [Roseivirga sp.]